MDEIDSDSTRDERGGGGGSGVGDADSVQDEAVERQHERAERVEGILVEVREDLGTQTYPVSSEELSARYADQLIDLPNETESLGSVFRRIDESFEDAEAAYEAVVAELSADERLGDHAGARGAEPPTWSEERAETQRQFPEGPNDDEDHESSVE